MIISIGLP